MAKSGLETCVVGDCVVDALINLLICVVINELEKNKDRNPFYVSGICPWPWLVRII